MRGAFLWPVVFFLIGLPVRAQFPVAITPAHAVSDSVTAAAAGHQMNPRVATNGDMSFVAWDDTREGTRPLVYGTRLDAEGNALDPAGLRIGEGPLAAVAWNGTAFVVVMTNSIAFIAPDKTITTRKLDLPLFYEYPYEFAAATAGPDVRFLFVHRWVGNVAIVDGHGEVITQKNLWSPPVLPWTACATDDGFLVLHGSPATMSDRLDRDGKLLSTHPTGQPFRAWGFTVAGDDDGFLVVNHDFERFDVTAYRLDAKGVYNGRSISLSIAGPNESHDRYGAAVVRDDTRYLVAWYATVPMAGQTPRSYQSIAEIADDDHVNVRRIEEWGGGGIGIALLSSGGRRLMAISEYRDKSATSADVMIRALADPLQPAESRVISRTRTQQAGVSVAATAHGFAVAWTENGPDGDSHAYVRRFSDTGTPLDAVPILVYSVPKSPNPYDRIPVAAATLASNDDTYVIQFFPGLDGPHFRRLAADSGAWIDPEPIPIGLGGYRSSFASNGRDLLALSIGYVELLGYCLQARRIAMRGEPLTSPIVTVRVPTDGALSYFVIASGGSDYLAAWLETPSHIYATRLGADGTVLDATPLLLEGGTRGAFRLQIAASEGRYLVGWSDTTGLRGTRITAEGKVLDRNSQGGGVLLAAARGAGASDLLLLYAAGLRRQFALLFSLGSWGEGVVAVDGVTLTSATGLGEVLAMPRRTVFRMDESIQGSVVMATNGTTIAVAYTAAPQSAGAVSRAYFQLFADSPRRRAAGH